MRIIISPDRTGKKREEKEKRCTPGSGIAWGGERIDLLFTQKGK